MVNNVPDGEKKVVIVEVISRNYRVDTSMMVKLSLLKRKVNEVVKRKTVKLIIEKNILKLGSIPN